MGAPLAHHGDLSCRQKRRRTAVGAWLQVLFLAATSAQAQSGPASYPNCTLESCQLCLINQTKSLQQIRLPNEAGDGSNLVNLRIARPSSSWDSHSVLAEILAFLVEEKLGVATDFVDCTDEVKCYNALLNCQNWKSDCQELVTSDVQGMKLHAAEDKDGEKQKVYPDAYPDVFVAVEIWTRAIQESSYKDTSNFDWGRRPIKEVGSTGFSVQDGMYVLGNVVEDAWQRDQLSLSSHQPYTSPLALAYMSTPENVINNNQPVEVEGCSSTESIAANGMNALKAMGYECRESWWLTPACAALGSRWKQECLVMFDDDWGYMKPDLYKAFRDTNMRVAKLTLGLSNFQTAVRSTTYNASFCWWNTDSSMKALDPVRVKFPAEFEAPQSIPVKSIYAPVQQVEPLRVLMDRMNVQDVESILRKTAYLQDRDDLRPVFRYVACEWLRDESNRDFWDAWIPRSCSAGQYYKKETESCEDCQRGWFSLGDKSTGCSQCPPGFFASTIGLSACAACDLGHYQPDPASAQCYKCEVGMYADRKSSTACVSCNATRSPAQLVTTLKMLTVDGQDYKVPVEDNGATQASACGCVKGAYAIELDVRCEPCIEGMECNGMTGSTPNVLPGYYATATPYRVYQCMNPERCPGGSPETCAGSFIGLVCSLCPDGKAAFGCKDCNAGAIFTVVLAPIVILMLVILAYWLGNSPITVNATVALTCSIFCGMGITCFQVFSIFKGLTVPWPSGVSHMFAALSIFTLDVGYVALECVFGQGSTVLYLVRALVPFVFVAWALVLFVLSRLAARTVRRPAWAWKPRRMLNTIGQSAQMLFIPFVVIAVRPLECFQHPSGAKSVKLFPHVICNTPEHVPLYIISGCLALLYLIPFMSVCIWVVVKAPSATGPAGARFFETCSFLMYSYRPDKWWWGPVCLVKQAALAFATSVPAGDPHSQVIYVCVVLCSYLCATFRGWPWKNSELNVFDACVSTSLLLVVISSLAFLPISTKSEVHLAVLSVFLAGLFGIFLLVALLILYKGLREGLQAEFTIVDTHELSSEGLTRRWQWWSGRWAQMDEQSVAGAIEILNAFDRTALGRAMAIWQSVDPDGVSAGEYMSSMSFARCDSWTHTSAKLSDEMKSTISRVESRVVLQSSAARTKTKSPKLTEAV